MNKLLITINYTFTNKSLTLRSYHRRFASAGRSRFGALFLEHGRVLQHVGQYEKPNLRPTNVDILQIGGSTVPEGDGDLGHLAVHVVLRLDQLSAINFTGDRFARHNVALRLVQHLDRYADRHGGDAQLLGVVLNM